MARRTEAEQKRYMEQRRALITGGPYALLGALLGLENLTENMTRGRLMSPEVGGKDSWEAWALEGMPGVRLIGTQTGLEKEGQVCPERHRTQVWEFPATQDGVKVLGVFTRGEETGMLKRGVVLLSPDGFKGGRKGVGELVFDLGDYEIRNNWTEADGYPQTRCNGPIEGTYFNVNGESVPVILLDEGMQRYEQREPFLATPLEGLGIVRGKDGWIVSEKKGIRNEMKVPITMPEGFRWEGCHDRLVIAGNKFIRVVTGPGFKPFTEIVFPVEEMQRRSGTWGKITKPERNKLVVNFNCPVSNKENYGLTATVSLSPNMVKGEVQLIMDGIEPGEVWGALDFSDLSTDGFPAVKVGEFLGDGTWKSVVFRDSRIGLGKEGTAVSLHGRVTSSR